MTGGSEVIDLRSKAGLALSNRHAAPKLQACPQQGEVEICLLGPVEVTGGDLTVLESSRRMAAMALLAYMASHRRPVTADELASNLWPLDTSRQNLGGPQRKTVMNLISRARAVLGSSAAADQRLIYTPMGYRLSDEVTCDWDRFERWVSGARHQPTAGAIARLRHALALVRGEPFGGWLSSPFFEWVSSEHLDLALSASVVEAAQDLAELALGAADFETVIWAAQKGLRFEPTREELFRLWMHALGRSGRRARVGAVYRRLELLLSQGGPPCQAPDRETRDVWCTYASAGAPRARI